MPKRRTIWQIYPSYIIITVISLAAASLYATTTFKDFYITKTSEDLYARALLVERLAEEGVISGDRAGLDRLAKGLGKEAAARMTIVTPDGVVVGDSIEDPATMENHADRPEVAAALAGKPGQATRFSNTLSESMMYVAIPVMDGGRVAGVVRAAVSVHSIQEALGSFYRRVAYGGLAGIVLAAAIGLVVSRRLTKPLVELERGAVRFARGELGGRLPLSDTEEIASLASAMNDMAARLDDRINMVTRQKNEQDAILASMTEGLLAVDKGGRVINMNQAAARLLSIDRESARGRSLQEVLRNTELRVFVEGALEADGPVELEFVFRDPDERTIIATGTKLAGQPGEGIGALVVLNDVTRLRRLEGMRREFVANVSHELRTPVTAIKGYAELLSEGGLDDRDAAAKFVDRILSQSNRLNAIIDDLLSLSQIERMQDDHKVELQECSVLDVLESAVQTCRYGADARDVDITVSCAEEVTAMLNPQLMEQAVVNLVVNAVKYSEPGSPVKVTCERKGGGVVISVSDRGYGIEQKHFPRLFERFYRVDRARSRDAGGTGLGLAIVKHIVQAHGGRITVDSSPGRGSTFTIYI